MDGKQLAAQEAVSFIREGMSVGLGAGSTMAFMANYLKSSTLHLQLYSSSAATKALLLQNGFLVNDIAGVSALDLYFDGCDQFDKDLNALKSGGGIHTSEKLFASMAKQFILVGDRSKYSEQLTTQYPLVLEILPQASSFVSLRVKQLYPGSQLSFRQNVLTENGNLLADIWFDVLPPLAGINSSLKAVTGVVETSLFYNMAQKAIVADAGGVSVLEK